MPAEHVKVCRTCLAEYRPEIERCPACDAVLELMPVAPDEEAFSPRARRGMPAERLGEGEPATPIGEFNLESTGGLAYELAAEKIPYRVEEQPVTPGEEIDRSTDQEASQADPLQTGGERGKASRSSSGMRFQILVHPDDAPRAAEILAEYRRAQGQDLWAVEVEDLTVCPACGSPLESFELGQRCPDCGLELPESPE